MRRQSATVCLIKSPTRQHRAIGPLTERLRKLAGPRHRRGKRHPFVSVLLIACSAVLCGARSFAAIGQGARNTPQARLVRLGARTATAFHVRNAPSMATIRRVLNAACPGGLADLFGHEPAGAQTPAVDGKSARGSRHGEIPAAHLLAATTGTGRDPLLPRRAEPRPVPRHRRVVRQYPLVHQYRDQGRRHALAGRPGRHQGVRPHRPPIGDVGVPAHASITNSPSRQAATCTRWRPGNCKGVGMTAITSRAGLRGGDARIDGRVWLAS